MPLSRRDVIRYGIAIDLVVLAAGVGLLYPEHPVVIAVTFIATAALSAWKGGWKGAWTAIVFGALVEATMFSDILGGARIAWIVAASVAVSGLVRWAIDGLAPTPERIAARERRAEEQRLQREEAEARARDEAERRARLEAERRAERERAEQERAALAAAAAAERERVEKQQLAEAKKQERRKAKEREKERAAEEKRMIAERAAAERAGAQRAAAERAEQLEREKREAAQRAEQLEREKQEAAARAEKLEQEKREAAERAQKLADEMLAAAEAAKRLEAERLAVAEEARRFAEEKRAAEEAAERRIAEERERLRQELEAKELELQRRLEEERARLIAEHQASIPATPPPPPPAPVQTLKSRTAAPPVYSRAAAQPSRSLLGTIAGWFDKKPQAVKVSLHKNRRAADQRTSIRPQRSAAARPAQKPRLLLFEKRRGTADTAIPKLRQRGIEVEVVERLVDAADEIIRFRPDAFFIDSELPDFEKSYAMLAPQIGNRPLFITGRSLHAFTPPPQLRYSSFIVRPYDVDALARLAREVYDDPDRFVRQQTPPPQPRPGSSQPLRGVSPAQIAIAAGVLSQSQPAAPVPPPITPIAAPPVTAPLPIEVSPQAQQREGSGYDATCFSCRVVFDAMEADWCSCLTKERTLVCTNCLTCFCKAPPSYKEKFWVEAPPALFERKTSDARRAASLPSNPAPSEVERPLVLAVEDDDEIQHIVHRVCSNLGYGFVYATNGQDGLSIARAYKPNLILSDAFMPKLDGREMCRMLKQEPAFADTKMVVMTGLYTDTKYRSEALKRFHVDEYLAKPVAITELINLLQRHLEGISELPMQADMYEEHRRPVNEMESQNDDDRESEGIPLAALLEEEENGFALALKERENAPAPRPKKTLGAKSDGYEVCCFNCGTLFDAATAEWCSCVGRDNTLVCPNCNGCFCKAPPAYREKFWIDAPSSLFERKMLGSKRHMTASGNPMPSEVKRPLILLVEDDENVQLIVRTVVTTMGFGFVVGANGQEGLMLAKQYNPDLILSDAFMPKLDGREMCRLLKQDPTTASVKAIIMTGLYTDRKYRNEALDYFKVDDYVAKPLAVDDLIKLFKKHLPQEVQQTM